MKDYLISQLKANSIEYSEEQISKILLFHEILIEKNKSLNLTRIIDDKEAVDKHYIDSLSLIPYFPQSCRDLSLVDLGTGAGFPGIPLAIFMDFKRICLVDSLKKRIDFLSEIKQSLNLNNLELVHERAEDLAHDKAFRESFDIVTARAVASLPTLLEYLVPLLKINSYCYCLKSDCEEEIRRSSNALKVLGAKIDSVVNIQLKNTDYLRNIVIIKKFKSSPGKYPRKAGIPKRQPL